MILLERDGDLRLLTGALEQAKTGHGGHVVIGGPLGCGKSALLNAILAHGRKTASIRVLTASGAVLERDFAFGVARQLLEPELEKACDETRERWLHGAAGLARFVFEDDAPDDAAVALQEAAVQGLTALTRAMSAETPLLLLIDDLQWVDEPSLHWLTKLARVIEELPILLVTALRDGERQAIGSRTEIRPAPLSRQAVALVIEECTGSTPDDEFLEVCHAQTGGNPMFLWAVLRHVTSPTADQIPHVRELRPARLRERLVRGLACQPRPVQEFAKAATVLGEDDDELAGQLAGLTPAQARAAARTLAEVGLLTTLPAVRDAIEELMPVEERELWQAKAVKLLHDEGRPAEQVAARLLAVTRSGWWAVGVLREAAVTAMRRGAPEVAARYLRRALRDVPEHSEERARLLVDLATAERFFDPAASVRHVSYAVPLFRDVRDRAVALVRIAPTALGTAPQAVRDLIDKVAADLGPAGDLAFRLEARQRYAWQSDPGLLADAALRLKEIDGGSPGARELQIVLLDAAMLTARMPAQEVARIATRVLAQEPPHPRHVHTAVPLLIKVLAAADAAHEAVPWLERALAATTGTVEHALIRAQQSFVFMHLGKPGDALQAAADAVELAALDWRGSTTTAAIGLTAVAMDLRDPALITRLLESRPDRDEPPCVDAVHRMLHATSTALAGDHATALDMFNDCGRAFDAAGWRNPVLLPWRLNTARLHARLGDLEAARKAAAVAWDRAVEWGAAVGIGRALSLLGRYTQGGKGLEMLHEAVHVLRANPFERAKALLELGARERAAGDPEAQQHLAEAHRLAERCGAEQLRARIARELDGNSPGILVPLTRTEFRVAGLVIQGLTNAEIAEQLAVTSRAIEKHLTNSFRKLGIRRRTELAGALSRAYPPAG